MKMHLKFMILCVSCALNWVVEAYKRVQTIYRILPQLYQKNSDNVRRSASGVFSGLMRTTSQLNMMSVSQFIECIYFNQF